VLTIQPIDWFGAQAVFVYQHDNNATPSAGDWYSGGYRVSLALTQHAKFLHESGRDTVIPKNGSGQRSLTKGTVALALTAAKGFWARPELRLFYTYAVWNTNAAIATVDSGKLYTTPDPNTGVFKLSGSIAGLQAEAMW
jgi:maltoporin